MYMCVVVIKSISLNFKANFYVTFLPSAFDDYTETSGTFTFTNTTLIRCVYVGIANDNISESSNECFTVRLSGGTDIPNVATVCIADDDG